MMTAAIIANHLVFCVAEYVRCHKAEPFLMLSLVNAVLVGSSTFWLGKWYGASGMSLGFMIITVIITLPWSLIIFKRKRELWH
jgi:O-antigen/teichoic acid export membrane protein